LSLLLLTACSAPSEPGAQSGEALKGPSGKVVVALTGQTTSTVDPALQGGASDFINLEPLYNRLTETAKENAYLREPSVAIKWSISPDGRTVEFQIRKGIRFHNGDELTPEDVVFTVERVQRMGAPSNLIYYARNLDSVQASGDSVVFKLKEPDWTVITALSSSASSIVPKKYIEKVGDDGFLKAPVGTGPFKFVSWSKQEYLDLAAVDYEHFLWQPGVKQLRYVIVPEETTRLAMVKTGEADLAQASVISMKSHCRGTTPSGPSGSPTSEAWCSFMFGHVDPSNPLSKLELRQALSSDFRYYNDVY